MFKTNDLYELITWLILSFVWFGKMTPKTDVLSESAQNKGIYPVESVTEESTSLSFTSGTEESRSIKSEVWFYGEALALSRNKMRKSNERRRKEDRRECAVEDNKKAGE